MHGKELLEELVQMRGVAFISDLHALLWTGETVQPVTAIPDDQFALEEWNEALQYLFDCRRTCCSVGEAKQLFSILADQYGRYTQPLPKRGPPCLRQIPAKQQELENHVQVLKLLLFLLNIFSYKSTGSGL